MNIKEMNEQSLHLPCPASPHLPNRVDIYNIWFLQNNPKNLCKKKIGKNILVSLPAPSPPLGEADRLAGTRSGTLVASERQCGIVTSVGRLIDREGWK